MSDITDVPYLVIREFILSNNKEIPVVKKSAYDLTFKLLKDKKSKGITLNLALWSFSYNLFINGINVNTYTESEIDNMSSVEINKLAKSLTMKNANVDNIKTILRYLHKLVKDSKSPVKDVELDPDVRNVIFDMYEQLKLSDINDYSDYDDLILLLKTYYNKNLVRMKINEYLDFIMDYNIMGSVDHDRIFKNSSDKWNDPRRDSTPKFIYDLIKLKEIGLAKRAIAVMSEYEKYYDGLPPMLGNLYNYARNDWSAGNVLSKLTSYIANVYGSYNT